MHCLWFLVILVVFYAIDWDYFSRFFLKYPEITSGSVLITGSSKGIGKAAALYFDSKGFRVYAGMRKLSDGDDLIRQSNGRIIPIKVDLGDLSNLGEVHAQIAADKEHPFVALIHNAATPNYGPFEMLTEKMVRDTYEVNIIAPALMTLRFMPQLRLNRGRVVFISSLSKFISIPYLGAYVSTKTGMDGLASVLRSELALFGGHASVVASGTVDTDINRNYVRDNHVEELAQAQQYSPEKKAEMERLYGCFYADNQTKHRDGLMTLRHTTRETNEAMFDAVTSAHPKNEYLLGWEGAVVGLLMRRMPLWVLDVYFRWQYYPGPFCFPEQGAVV